MTRHTATQQRRRARIPLDVIAERDESSRDRHKWTTTVRLGLWSGTGANVREASQALLAQLVALANSDAAKAGFDVEAAAHADLYRAEQAQVGTEVALERARLRLAGEDPPHLWPAQICPECSKPVGGETIHRGGSFYHPACLGLEAVPNDVLTDDEDPPF